MDLQTIQAIRAKLLELSAQAPVLRKLADGTITRADCEDLARACTALGAPELAPALRNLGHGASADKVLGEMAMRHGVLELLQELRIDLSEGRELAQAIAVLFGRG